MSVMPDVRAPRRAWECRCDDCLVGLTDHSLCEHCQEAATHLTDRSPREDGRKLTLLCERCYDRVTR